MFAIAVSEITPPGSTRSASSNPPALAGREVLEVRGGPLVVDRPEPHRRRDAAGRLHGHDDRRLRLGLVDVDPHRGVAVAAERVADAPPDAPGIERRTEELPRRLLESAEMEREAARPTAAHLHRREVAEPRRRLQ
jgi:hypothetical protein